MKKSSIRECVRNQGRSWKRLLILCCLLLVLTFAIIVTVGYYVIASSAKDVIENMGEREEVIAEFMAKRKLNTSSDHPRDPLPPTHPAHKKVEHHGSAETNKITDHPQSKDEEKSSPSKVDPLDVWKAPEWVLNAFPHYFSGYDKQNRPVWVVRVGQFTIQKHLDDGDKDSKDTENLVDMYVYQLAHRINQSRFRMKNGESDAVESVRSGWALIVDMEGYTYSQFLSMKMIKLYIRASKILQPMIAEVDYGIIVNLDLVSKLLINIIQPLLGNEGAKMSHFGTDKKEYLDAILTHIPPTQVPKMYGGTLEDFKPIAIYGHPKI